MKWAPVPGTAAVAVITYLAVAAPPASEPPLRQVDRILAAPGVGSVFKQLRNVQHGRIARDDVKEFFSPQPPPQRELLRLEDSIKAMGTTYTVVLYGYTMVQMQAAMEAAFHEVRRVDRMLSNYRPDSELSEVNRHAAEGPCQRRSRIPQKRRLKIPQ
jgi:hypothetical protein